MTAYDAAIDLIEFYVLRGDDPKILRGSRLSAFTREYRAGIGGWFYNGPLAHKARFGTDKILVHQVGDEKCAEAFSFDEIYRAIRQRNSQLTLGL
jgi:hypothetical protein